MILSVIVFFILIFYLNFKIKFYINVCILVYDLRVVNFFLYLFIRIEFCFGYVLLILINID